MPKAISTIQIDIPLHCTVVVTACIYRYETGCLPQVLYYLPPWNFPQSTSESSAVFFRLHPGTVRRLKFVRRCTQTKGSH